MTDATIMELARVTVLNEIRKNYTIPVGMDDIHAVGFETIHPYMHVYVTVDGLEFFVFRFTYCFLVANGDFLRTYKLENSGGVRREVESEVSGVRG